MSAVEEFVSMKPDRRVLSGCVHNGLVDYESLARERSLLHLIDWVAATDLSQASRAEQLAFFLNAYNLITLNQALRRLSSNPRWAGNTTLWEKARFFLFARHRVAGETHNLLTLENGVIRARFNEPRIHFALNCASRSCPPLSPQLLEAETLDRDLEHLTSEFIHSDKVTYEASGNRLVVSPIFKWYRRDFGPSVQGFIARYRDVPVDAVLSYQSYDWSLNRA